MENHHYGQSNRLGCAVILLLKKVATAAAVVPLDNKERFFEISVENSDNNLNFFGLFSGAEAAEGQRAATKSVQQQQQVVAGKSGLKKRGGIFSHSTK